MNKRLSTLVHNQNTSRWLMVALLVIALYVLVPQFGSFKGSLTLLRHPRPGYAALALGAFLLTYLIAAVTYMLLALRKLAYFDTVRVQMASVFASRLAPAGLGSLGVNYLYLRKTKHTAAQSAAVLTVNNLLGFAGNGLIVLALLLALPAARPVVHLPHMSITRLQLYGIVAGVFVLIVVTAWIGRARVQHGLRDILKQLGRYRSRKAKLSAALLSSTLLTSCNMLSLYGCAHAFGIQLTFVAAAVIFSFGMGIGTSVPTPGGLGGMEAGLLAGLLAIGADSAAALAAVVLFRLIGYWLALVIGAVALFDCRRRKLFYKMV